MKTICIETDSAQGAMINCCSEIQTKANERERSDEGRRLTARRVGGAGRAAMTEW